MWLSTLFNSHAPKSVRKDCANIHGTRAIEAKVDTTIDAILTLYHFINLVIDVYLQFHEIKPTNYHKNVQPQKF